MEKLLTIWMLVNLSRSVCIFLSWDYGNDWFCVNSCNKTSCWWLNGEFDLDWELIFYYSVLGIVLNYLLLKWLIWNLLVSLLAF